MTWLAALSSGFLLFASDHPLHLWWLQFVALVPLWWALAETRTKGRWIWPLGLFAATANAVPLTISAGAVPPILAAAVFVLVQWPILASIAGRLLTTHAVLGPLGAAAVLTLGEVATWYLVPLFGTAQCFVRPLSAAPTFAAFVAYTGVGGLVFVVAAMQALAVAALRGPDRRRPLLALAALLAVVGALDALRLTRATGPMLRAAAAGWNQFPGDQKKAITAYDALLGEAAAAGARLLVTPETATGIGVENVFLGTAATAARDLAEATTRHGLCAAIGVFHHGENDNRAWLVAPGVGLVAEYRKTHLIPWLESYVAGDGTLVQADVDGARLGAMICQDDNFTDLGRGYGRLGVQVVAVPTNDWPSIREYHLENGVFRALENGYAVVRAASNGVSALISARGEVVARHDHVRDDARVLVDDVEIGDGVPTLYARYGDLPIAVLCVALLAAASAARRRAVV